MNFPFRQLFYGHRQKYLVILVALFIIGEGSIGIKTSRQYPILKRVPQITKKTLSSHNHSFVYFNSHNISYPKLTNRYFNISIKSSVLHPFYKKCVSAYDDSGFISIGYNDASTTWKDIKDRESQYSSAEADGMTLTKELIKTARDSYQPYIPTTKELRAFEDSDAYEEGWRYLSEGWFYKPKDYDIVKTYNYYLRRSPSGSSFNFYYVGNPLITLGIEAISLLYKHLKNNQNNVNKVALQQLFQTAKVGDLRVRFYIFNPTEISTVAFKKARSLTIGKYKQKPLGNIVRGLVPYDEVLRPPTYDSLLTFLRIIVSWSLSRAISRVSATPKERNLNLLLLGSIVFMFRCSIWNTRILNPGLGALIFSLMTFIYARS